jgi:hypothetical protein
MSTDDIDFAMFDLPARTPAQAAERRAARDTASAAAAHAHAEALIGGATAKQAALAARGAAARALHPAPAPAPAPDHIGERIAAASAIADDDSADEALCALLHLGGEPLSQADDERVRGAIGERRILAEIRHALTGRWGDDLRAVLAGQSPEHAAAEWARTLAAPDVSLALSIGITAPDVIAWARAAGILDRPGRLAKLGSILSGDLHAAATYAHALCVTCEIGTGDVEALLP